MQINENLQKRMGLRNLSAAQLAQLHEASLKILAEVGVKVCLPEALALLKLNGAQVDGDLVRMPDHLVETALKTAPSTLSIYDRSGAGAMILGTDKAYFGTGSDTPYIIDIYNGQRRKTVKEDTVNASRLADALENIDFIMAMARASDVPEARTDRHHFEAMILNSTKPIIFDAHDQQGLDDIINMAALVRGSRQALAEKPFIIHYCEPISPLIHSRIGLEKLLKAAENQIPLVYAPAVMCGATGPVTTAGALVVANAEILSGLVIHQLKKSGAPYIYGGGTPPLNMITTVCSYGDPQAAVGAASLVELARYYQLPSFTIAGCSDAHANDQQATMEAGFNLLMSALVGGNLVHDLGYIGVGLTYSLEYLIICNEGAGAARFITRGVEINDDSLALDVIAAVGPGGHFLTEQHTMDHFRREMHFTRLFNRNSYDNWVAAGSKEAGQSANEMLKEILQWHEVAALPADVAAEIKRLAQGD